MLHQRYTDNMKIRQKFIYFMDDDAPLQYHTHTHEEQDLMME